MVVGDLIESGVLGGTLDLCFLPDCNLPFSQSLPRDKYGWRWCYR